MKLFRLLALAALAAVIMPQQASAKKVVLPKAYLYGFVANFTDSVVYFTDIQSVDSVWYDTKNMFLLGRSSYSNQLREYFTNTMKKPHSTCIVGFGLTRSQAEKKLLKLKKLYTDKNAGSYDVHSLNENQFHFTTVEMGEETSAPSMTKAEQKAAKKKHEEALKRKKLEAKAKKAEAKALEKREKAKRKAQEQQAKLTKKQKPLGPPPTEEDPLPPAEVEMK